MLKEKDRVVFRSENIGQVIRDYREFLGLSRKDFAEMFKLKVNVLRNMEETVNAFRYAEATTLLLEILHCEYEAEDEIVTLDTKLAEFWRALYLFDVLSDFNRTVPKKDRLEDFLKRFTSPLPIQDQVDLFSVLCHVIGRTFVYSFNEEEDIVEETGKQLLEEVKQRLLTRLEK